MNLGQAWHFSYVTESDIIYVTESELSDDLSQDQRESLIGSINHPRHRINAQKECREVLKNLDRFIGVSGCAANGQNEIVNDKVRVNVTGVMYMEDNSCYTEYLVKELEEIIPDGVIFRIIHWSWTKRERVILEEINGTKGVNKV